MSRPHYKHRLGTRAAKKFRAQRVTRKQYRRRQAGRTVGKGRLKKWPVEASGPPALGLTAWLESFI